MRSKDSFSVFSGSLRTLYPPSSASQPRNPWNFTWGRSVILVLAHSAPPEPRPNPVRPITALFSMLPTNKGTKRHVDNSSTSTIRSMRPQEAFRAWPMRPLITCCLRSRDSSYHNSSQDTSSLDLSCELQNPGNETYPRPDLHVLPVLLTSHLSGVSSVRPPMLGEPSSFPLTSSYTSTCMIFKDLIHTEFITATSKSSIV